MYERNDFLNRKSIHTPRNNHCVCLVEGMYDAT